MIEAWDGEQRLGGAERGDKEKRKEGELEECVAHSQQITKTIT